MSYLNLKIEFVDSVPSSGDTIIIGSYDGTDDFDSYLKKADVEIDSDIISTVAFGEVDRAGNAVVLFDAGKKGNTLVLLADNSDDLIALIGVFNYGTLSSCLTSENVAVCSVGYGDYYYEDTSSDTSTDGTTTDGSSTESTPEATATPSG
jgi:hypothetical protein